jgi:hypothetical protein
MHVWLAATVGWFEQMVGVEHAAGAAVGSTCTGIMWGLACSRLSSSASPLILHVHTTSQLGLLLLLVLPVRNHAG